MARSKYMARGAAGVEAAHHNGSGVNTYSIGLAFRELIIGVEWTPAFMAFLYYIAVVTTNRVPGADVAVVAALIFLLLRIDQLRVGRAVLFLGLLTAWAWISYLVGGQDPNVYTGTWELTKIWLISFAAFNAIRTRAQLRFFFAFALLCFLVYPVRGALLNYFLVGHTASGRAIWNYAYSNPNDLAAFSIVFASMAVALALVSRSKLIRIGSVIATGGILFLILLTQSRGAILAVAVVGALVAVRRLRNIRVMLVAGTVVTAVVVLTPDKVWERLGGLANISLANEMHGVDEEGSAEQRWQIAQIAARIARDNMAFGVGAGAYSEAHGVYAANVTSEFNLGAGNRDAHNTYLRTAAELGMIGLVLLLLELGSALWAGRRRSGPGRHADAFAIGTLKLGLVAYMLAGVFGSFAYIVMLHLLVVSIESLAAVKRTPEKRFHLRS